MVLVGSFLKVLDNSGVKEVKCIGILGVGKRRFAKVGDVLKVSVRNVRPNKKVSKGMVFKAVLVSVKKRISRKGGEAVRFDSNGVVLLRGDGMPLGTRVLGAVMGELRSKGFVKVISLAKVTV